MLSESIYIYSKCQNAHFGVFGVKSQDLGLKNSQIFYRKKQVFQLNLKKKPAKNNFSKHFTQDMQNSVKNT